MLQFLERAGYALQLMRDLIADRDGFDEAGRANFSADVNVVMNVLDREILRVNVLFVISLLWRGWLRFRSRRLSFRCCDGWTRVVFLSLAAELAILALLVLLQKYVKLAAKVFQLLVKLAVSLQGQLQLLGQLQVDAIRVSELNAEVPHVLALPSVFLPEVSEFLVA
jgi:hypothetical protein